METQPVLDQTPIRTDESFRLTEERREEEPKSNMVRNLVIGAVVVGAVAGTIAFVIYKRRKDKEKKDKERKEGKVDEDKKDDAPDSADQRPDRQVETPTNPVAFLKMNEEFRPGQWRQSVGKKYYVTQKLNGALEVYRGSGPSDANKLLIWTTGNRGVVSGEKCFTVVQPDGNICTYVGENINLKERSVFCSGTAPERDVSKAGTLSLTIQDDGFLTLKGSNSSSVILWQTDVGTSVLKMDVPLWNGRWLQSDNKQYFAIQQNDGSIEIYNNTNPGVLKSELKFVWKSRDAGPERDYFSILQGDGNFVTYTGRLGDGKGTFWWNAGGAVSNVTKDMYIKLADNGELQRVIPGTSKPTVLSDRGLARHTTRSTPHLIPSPVPGAAIIGGGRGSGGGGSGGGGGAGVRSAVVPSSVASHARDRSVAPHHERPQVAPPSRVTPGIHRGPPLPSFSKSGGEAGVSRQANRPHQMTSPSSSSALVRPRGHTPAEV